MADIMPASGTPETAEDAAHAAAKLPPPKGLRLVQVTGSRWIAFPEYPGVRLRVKPMTTPLMVAAESRARRRMRDEMERDPEKTVQKDWALGYGALFTFIAEEMARHLVEDWEGVQDADGNPLPFSEAALGALMLHPSIAERFSTEVRRPLDEVVAEGNA